jgi:hypothetical protein
MTRGPLSGTYNLCTAGARDGVRANPVSVLRQEIAALGLGCLTTGMQTIEIY